VQHVGRKLAVSGEQPLGIARRKLGQEPAAVADPVGFHQEDELVCGETHRDLRGDLLDRQVEYLPGRRVAERRDQQEIAVVEPLSHPARVDATHLSGEPHVDAVEDADRLGGDEIPADHAYARARHRRVGDAEREQCLDAAARVAHAFEHAIHRLRVGDAQPLVIAARDVLLLQDRLDLRARAVHDDQPHTEAVQEVQVVHDAEKALVGDDFAAEGDDQRLAAESVYVRRGGAYPRNE
jgi:hypothetical protein